MDFQNIMKELLNPTHKLNRSGKDLTARKVLSLKAGQLAPILCKEMVPNDYFEVDTAALVRTAMPLRTAAFLRARVHFDFFFVPKTAIWRNFDRFYYQRDNRETSYMKSFAYEPNIPLKYICEECDTSRHVSGDVFDTPAHRAKLAQLLGYSTFGYSSPGDWSPASGSDPAGKYYTLSDKSLTILPVMGYHRIYNMWYRNAWRDEPSQYDVNMMSADNWDCSSYANSLFQNNYPCGPTDVNSPSIFQMHFHPWMSDIFMGSLPNQQFGSVSSIDMVGTVTFNDTNHSSATVAGSAYPPSGITTGTIYGPNDNYTSGNRGLVSLPSFDVLALRKALALQKWKEYNMRAGWKNRSQARAMFGVSTPEDRKHEIEFLKGYEFPVMIDEVTNQSNTNLGELAGKGIGVGNGELLKFNSGERHGYLYCIAYILPQAEYDAVGIDKQLVRSEPFDHFVPAFENLGMEPIYKYELNATGSASTFDSVLGYAPRYHEYKTDYDKVYGEFMKGGQLDSWVSVRNDLQSAANSGFLPTRLFYVNPGCLDSIFGLNAGSDETTDQFMLNVNIVDKAVRPMSDLGLPTL